VCSRKVSPLKADSPTATRCDIAGSTFSPISSRAVIRPREKKEVRRTEVRRSNFRNLSEDNVHPPRGERGAFRKITTTVPAALYNLVVDEVAQRKRERESGADFAAVVREAIAVFFTERGKKKKSKEA